MSEMNLFGLILFCNLACSAIGPFFILGPIFGFPIILLYSWLVTALRTPKLSDNLCICFGIGAIIVSILTVMNDMFAVGLFMQSVGIITGAALSTVILTKKGAVNAKDC